MKSPNVKSKHYAALVVDLDGTLIGRGEQISPRVAQAVGKVVPRLRVSIASGREPSDVLGFARQLGLTAPQVSDNGAMILSASSGRPLWTAPLQPARAREIVDILRHLGLAFIATHLGGTLLMSPKTCKDASEITHWNHVRVSALDMEESQAEELVARFSARSELNVVKASLPYNGLWAVDFTAAGVNKGAAVQRMARMLGIDAETIIAAGDSYNDLPLLRLCGLRIAMGDAPDELKDIADFVAPSMDEDGLAVAIEEFVLPRL